MNGSKLQALIEQVADETAEAWLQVLDQGYYQQVDSDSPSFDDWRNVITHSMSMALDDAARKRADARSST